MSLTMKNNYIILLTGCINPQGMILTKLQDKEIRLKQYLYAINWYLEHTYLPIVFVENTNFNLSPHYTDIMYSDRFEYITFDGNHYDKTKGKGYGEALIIKHAFNHSTFIKENTCIIKITGRLIVQNVLELLNDYKKMLSKTPKDIICCDVNRKLTTAFSRIVFMPYGFCVKFFFNEIERINDSLNNEFENILSDSIHLAVTSNNFDFSLFKRQYYIIGMSGTTAKKIVNKSNLKIYIKYILFKIGFWGHR